MGSFNAQLSVLRPLFSYFFEISSNVVCALISKTGPGPTGGSVDFFFNKPIMYYLVHSNCFSPYCSGPHLTL